MTQDPRAKLRDLLDKLNGYRIELDLALERGEPHVIANAQRLISTQQLLILQHCERSDLPLPADLPGNDV